jgi:hypothetical protein
LDSFGIFLSNAGSQGEAFNAERHLPRRANGVEEWQKGQGNTVNSLTESEPIYGGWKISAKKRC